MKFIRLTTLFLLALPVLAAPSLSSAETPSPTSAPKINFSLLSIEYRILKDVRRERADFLVQYPVFHEEHSIMDDLAGGPFYYDTRIFSQVRDYKASTAGIGKFTYGLESSEHNRTAVIPSVTLYRTIEIEYPVPSGDTVSHERKSILLPSLQIAHRLTDTVALHFEGELYNYDEPGNYVVRAGVSYALSTPVVLSAVYERLSWHIESDEGGTITAMHGRSQAAIIKGIYSFLDAKHEKSGWNLYLAAGYEQLVNRGTPGVVAQGDIDTSGLTVRFGASFGLASW